MWFGYVTFNVKYYILSQIFYNKIGCLIKMSISNLTVYSIKLTVEIFSWKSPCTALWKPQYIKIKKIKKNNYQIYLTLKKIIESWLYCLRVYRPYYLDRCDIYQLFCLFPLSYTFMIFQPIEIEIILQLLIFLLLFICSVRLPKHF